MRESRKLGDEWLCNYFGVFTLGVTRSLDVSLPESGTRSNVVNVLLDVGRHVICIGRNVMTSRCMLPDIEVSDEQIFDFGSGRIELDPLKGIINICFLEEF